MKIIRLRTNQMNNPLGFKLDPLRLSWTTEAEHSLFQTAARVEIAADEAFTRLLFDSGKREDIDSLAYTPDLSLIPRTRYYWRVTVWGDGEESATSAPAWFETAKMEEAWQGEWITPDLDKDTHPLIRKTFHLPEKAISARLYISGVGLYEVNINGKRVGDEYLAPGFHAYDFWLQYQTYDLTGLLQKGENGIGLMLGNGWYKGRFGFVKEGYHNLYGDEFAVRAEIVAELAGGSSVVLGTDGSWKSAPSPVLSSSIYDGELYDATREMPDWTRPVFDDKDWAGVHSTMVQTEKFQARLSLPVKIKEERKPEKVIHTPSGETVLDMGQNMTGWIRFRANLNEGAKVTLQYGEILQEGNFYNDNLRTAKAEYNFISDGRQREIQPHFTFFGFRYVKVTGFGDEVNPEDFTGCVLYSDLEETGSIETSEPLVNRLFQNALWGQKGNFLDVPTDCPQRDERMGWTGDAQIFASTACFNMYAPAFFAKYMYDLHQEQFRLDGSVPYVVPMIKPGDSTGLITGNGSAAWGDAATIIPWTLYQHYGDKALLRRHFSAMKEWVDYIRKLDEETGNSRLWKVNFHFGDWLSLDTKDPLARMGGTDSFYIASAYYCYSATLVAKAAAVLSENETAQEYSRLAEEVRQAMYREYFTPSGRCAIPTQTAIVVALYMDLVPEAIRPRLIADLKEKLLEEDLHLTTGFVGTPYLCHVLSENGLNDLAYTLLLNEDYPGWLYAVKMGATTVWERWNSVLPDGSISDTGMNSLNHYAYGSIAEWMYRSMCGINPVEEAPGFRKIKLAPKPDGRLAFARANLDSASGRIESSWELSKEGFLSFRFTIPFNTIAELMLPDARSEAVNVNGKTLLAAGIPVEQKGRTVICELKPGRYLFRYLPSVSYHVKFSSADTLDALLSTNKTREVFYQVFPELAGNEIIRSHMTDKPVREMLKVPAAMGIITGEKLDRLDEQLARL